jgi:hypothetical protein
VTRCTLLALILVALAGCAIPPAYIGLASAGFGFAAGAERLDDDVFNYWAAHRGVTVVPAVAK